MHEDDELDLLLDSALSAYADPGKDSGLEERILTRISTCVSAPAAPAPRRRWMVWAIALPLTACLLLFLFSGPRPTHPPISHVGQEPRPQQPPVLDARTEAQSAPRLQPLPKAKALTLKAHSRPVTLATDTIPLPKLDVFPTPRPLSAEERAIVSILLQTPEPELKALAEAQKQRDTLLSIAAIHIPQLEQPDLGTN